MANVDESDNGLHRLGKLVPSYIIALITTLQPSLEFLHEEFQGWDILYLIFLILGVFVTFYVIDIRVEKVHRKTQIIFTIIIIGVYSLQTFIAIVFNWPTPIKMIASGIAVILTILAPYIIKGGDKYMRFIVYDSDLNSERLLADPKTVTEDQMGHFVYFYKDILLKYQNNDTNYEIGQDDNNKQYLKHLGGPPWSITFDFEGVDVVVLLSELITVPGKEQEYMVIHNK